MIRINQVQISIFEKGPEKALVEKVAKMLHIPTDGFRKFRVLRRSIDARDKNDIRFSYIVEVKLRDTFTGPSRKTEQEYVDKLKNGNITVSEYIPVTIPDAVTEGKDVNENRPVIVGAGPCGLFTALALCSAGLRPVIAERGKKAEDRKTDVDRFFETGVLDTSSNVQFGEGGAGLFSDGKLNTSVKDKESYIRFVLETFAEFGADPDILVNARPHIGTDVLFDVIKNIRSFIEEKGGTFYYQTKFTGFETENGQIKAAIFEGAIHRIETDTVILATGHSARDTYHMLQESGVTMEKKPFAVGVRIQHPQSLIDEGFYGEEDLEEKTEILGPAAYNLSHRCKNGRSIFSFCMCPGGYVINSSSEEGGTVVNGMSYSDRDSGAANSAIIVNVDPEDFPGDTLSGLSFQREMEEKAYALAGGLIPYESYREFKEGEEHPTGDAGCFTPAFCGMALPADVRSVLPGFVADAVTEGIDSFGERIRGFDGEEAVIAGVESRTSSPVRVIRNDMHETKIAGLYAAGEGAGYAGGITSAAVDGLITAIHVIEHYNGR